MSKRPARIVEDIEVPLPRPRVMEQQEAPEFAMLKARIRKLIEH